MSEPIRTEPDARAMDRRRFLRWAAPLPILAPLVISACANASGGEEESTPDDASSSGSDPTTSSSSPTTRQATPACDDADPTHENVEGPFYSDGAPERTNLRDGVSGTNLTVTGQVVDTNCEPIPGAILDFWQADDNGQYDNTGYTLRGWQRADSDGRYTLETIRPRFYQGRTAHIHVKVQASESAPILTTQLFFPGEPMNDSDALFDSALLMDVSDGADGQNATFDFVLES
jgi:protocatechuate 3,4-dioxygenase beta subunit